MYINIKSLYTIQYISNYTVIVILSNRQYLKTVAKTKEEAKELMLAQLTKRKVSLSLSNSRDLQNNCKIIKVL